MTNEETNGSYSSACDHGPDKILVETPCGVYEECSKCRPSSTQSSDDSGKIFGMILLCVLAAFAGAVFLGSLMYEPRDSRLPTFPDQACLPPKANLHDYSPYDKRSVQADQRWLEESTSVGDRIQRTLTIAQLLYEMAQQLDVNPRYWDYLTEADVNKAKRENYELARMYFTDALERARLNGSDPITIITILNFRAVTSTALVELTDEEASAASADRDFDSAWAFAEQVEGRDGRESTFWLNCLRQNIGILGTAAKRWW